MRFHKGVSRDAALLASEDAHTAATTNYASVLRAHNASCGCCGTAPSAGSGSSGLWVLYARLSASYFPTDWREAMAKRKKKGKRATKQPNDTEAAEMRIVAAEKAAGMSATALAAFARDLAAFGSRRGKRTRTPAQ